MKASKLFYLLISLLIMVLSLAFILIEARLILSCDWFLYENLILGLIQYICRVLVALYALYLSIIPFLDIYHRISYTLNKHMINSISLLVISFILNFYVVNHIGLIFIVACIIYMSCGYAYFN